MQSIGKRGIVRPENRLGKSNPKISDLVKYFSIPTQQFRQEKENTSAQSVQNQKISCQR